MGNLLKLLVLALIGWAYFSSVSCGIAESKYVNYQEVVTDTETSTTTDTAPALTECQTEALSLFTSGVNGNLVASCAVNGCHNATGVPISGQNLDPDSVDTNYTVIKAYTGTDANTLFDKLSGNPSHGGGDRSSDLPLAGIQAWTDKEAECAAE